MNTKGYQGIQNKYTQMTTENTNKGNNGEHMNTNKGEQRKHTNESKGVQRNTKECKGIQRNTKECKGTQSHPKGIQREKRSKQSKTNKGIQTKGYKQRKQNEYTQKENK